MNRLQANKHILRMLFVSILLQMHQYVFSQIASSIVTGAERTELYLPLLSEKRVAVVANQSSLIQHTHLVDSLLKRGINIVKVFCPEHGFRGTADAGAHIADAKDTQTGLPLISLYGNHKKPTAGDMDGIDVVIFDIQDVGVRFYTYVSTMHYVMEACAENHISMLVLDRPNPNGFYVDGPVLDTVYRSFVGMHPVPLVHGMTLGEFALMINGEKWLTNGVQCNVSVVPCINYTHSITYEPPVKPSPNLPNLQSILLYPSLGLFEGTIVSVGRGTDFPFQVYGHPDMKKGTFEFTPVSKPGATDPKFKNTLCKGYYLQPGKELSKQLNISFLLQAYKGLGKPKDFFNNYFVKLAGTFELQQQIEKGLSEEEIRESWNPALERFKTVRKNYLLYSE